MISEKSLKILDGNIANLNETLKSTRAMFSAGMAESTDVDQMVSNVTMVENTRSSMQRTIEFNYNLLRFQLGYLLIQKSSLEKHLRTLIQKLMLKHCYLSNSIINKNVEYMLIEGQEQMSSLALKSQKASVLPTLAGFYNYGTNGMGEK